jgi:hypothetical protein
MERHILQWSYWLGIASLIVAALWKAANACGLGLVILTTYHYNLPMTFYKGSLLLLVAAIASANCVWLKSQKP